MVVLRVLLLALLAAHSRAVDENPEKDVLQGKDCNVDSCGRNPLPIPMCQNGMYKSSRSEKESRLAMSLLSSIDGEYKLRTNFSCDDKPHVPGFYADMEADCKVFHFCAEGIVKHYRCRKLDAFNQKTLSCENAEDVQCHLTPTYFAVNADFHDGHPVFRDVRDYMFSNISEGAYNFTYDYPETTTDAEVVNQKVNRMLHVIRLFDLGAEVVAKGLMEKFTTLRPEGTPIDVSNYSQRRQEFLNSLQDFVPTRVEYSSDQTPSRDSSERAKRFGRSAASDEAGKGASSTTGPGSLAGDVEKLLLLTNDYILSISSEICSIMNIQLATARVKKLCNDSLVGQ